MSKKVALFKQEDITKKIMVTDIETTVRERLTVAFSDLTTLRRMLPGSNPMEAEDEDIPLNQLTLLVLLVISQCNDKKLDPEELKNQFENCIVCLLPNEEDQKNAMNQLEELISKAVS
mgnify:CR=1 FL=1